MSFVSAPKQQFHNVTAALQWLADQKVERILYGEKKTYLLKETVGPLTKLFLWRYREGAIWTEVYKRAAKANIVGGPRLIREKTARMAGLVEWMTEGVISPVYVPPHGYAKTEAGRLLRERMEDAKDKVVIGKQLSAVNSQLSREEGKEGAILNDAPIYTLTGPGESLTDFRLRRRMRRKFQPEYIGPRRAPPNSRTIPQELLLLSIGRVSRRTQEAYQLGATTLKRARNGRSLLGKSGATEYLMGLRGLGGWAALAVLRIHGLGGLPPKWFRILFDSDRARDLENQYGKASGHAVTVVDRLTRFKYSRRLWLALGSSRGMAAVFPLPHRSKENSRALFRAVKRYLDEVEFDARGYPIGYAPELGTVLSAILEPDANLLVKCRMCNERKAARLFPYRDRAAGIRHTSCVDCRKLKDMDRTIRTKLKLIKAARRAAKENGVQLVRKKPRQQVPHPYEDEPSTMEEFVIQLDDPQGRLDRVTRKVDRMMARATGGYAERDLDRFMESVR